MSLPTIKVSQVPFDQAISLAGRHPLPHEISRFSIYDTGDTSKCLLDCSRWEKKYEILSQRRSNSTQNKEKRKEARLHAKETIESHRRSLPTAQRYSNSALRSKRKDFTLSELACSVQSGCGSCRYYQTLLDGLFLVRPNLKNDGPEFRFQWNGPSLLSMTEQGSGKSYAFQFFSPNGATDIVQGFHSANLLHGDTSSPVSFDRATRWIDECESSHERCGVGRNVPLPRRLLDLEAVPGKQDLKLVATVGGTTGTYACLSHCWGKDPMPVRATTQTVKDYLATGIPWESVPRTFQDAATITRRLGIRYLWIDSLCIIQDSVPDWEDQSGKMADIYRNSYITIAAASSSDFRGGCFSTDLVGDLCFEMMEAKTASATGRSTIIAVRGCKGTAQLTETNQVTQVFPLLSRAWVYQERILSRRVLYCNQSELQFECRESINCECANRFITPHPHPKTPAGNSMMPTIKKQYAEVMDRVGDSARLSPAQLSQHWNLVVTQYSRLRLTYASDTLPALSGCAKDLARLTGDLFVAGIWAANLAEGLLWSMNPPLIHPRPAEPRRAPSWSWASVDTSSSGLKFTHVMRTRTKKEFQDRVVAVQCQPAGGDTTGAVAPGGYLEVKSRLYPAYLRRLCRECARSRHKYTIEHAGVYRPRNKTPSESWRSRACRFAADSWTQGRVPDLGDDADVVVFPDFKYDDRTDFEFFDALDGRACKLARIEMLHLYDGQSFETQAVTDFFLVLKKNNKWDGGVRKEKSRQDDVFERVALATFTFGSWVKRQLWFTGGYLRYAHEEGVVRVV